MWLLPCQLTFPYIYFVSSMACLFFYNRVFFLFSSNLFLAYPQHHSFTYSTQPPYFFCCVFPIPLCSASPPIFTYACAQNHSRENPQILMAYVSNTCSTSTSWYGLLPPPSLSHVLSAQLLLLCAYRWPRPILALYKLIVTTSGVSSTNVGSIIIFVNLCRLRNSPFAPFLVCFS